MRKIRTPPGQTTADVRQEIIRAWVRRTAEGYAGAKLFVRVWGDVKDEMGRWWRRYYAGSAEGGPSPGDPARLHDTPEPYAVAPQPDLGAVSDVRDAVARLTPRQRHAITRVVLEGAPREVVAGELGISSHAVTVLMCRAKDKLRELLVDYAPPTDE